MTLATLRYVTEFLTNSMESDILSVMFCVVTPTPRTLLWYIAGAQKILVEGYWDPGSENAMLSGTVASNMGISPIVLL